MTLVLPPWNQDLHTFAASLDEEHWEEILGSLRDRGAEVVLPKFQLGDDLKLKDPLQRQGMKDAFLPAQADFTEMNRLAMKMGLHVHEVRHATWLDVNEQGTEAAAVTSVEMRAISGPTRIRFDRPFLFAIRERLSGTLVFIGLVENPNS